MHQHLVGALSQAAAVQAQCGQRLAAHLPTPGSMGWTYVAPQSVPQNVAAQAWYLGQQPSLGGNYGPTNVRGTDGKMYSIQWVGVAGNQYYVTVVYVWGPLPSSPAV